jgi:hypothetical protein
MSHKGHRVLGMHRVLKDFGKDYPMSVLLGEA